MTSLFNGTIQAQLRNVVQNQSRREMENSGGEDVYRIVFSVGQFSQNESNFRPSISEDAFDRLLQRHTGHCPYFKIESRQYHNASGGDRFRDLERCISEEIIATDFIDVADWNLRISSVQHRQRTLTDKESVDIQSSTTSIRHSFKLDRSLRLDLIQNVQSTIKPAPSYELHFVVFPHQDHVNYTPGVMNQTILPALNSVLQILQDTNHPMNMSQIHELENKFYSLVNQSPSELLRDANYKTILTHETLRNLSSGAWSVRTITKGDAGLIYFADDCLYLFTEVSGWRQISHKDKDLFDLNETILVGSFNGLNLTVQEIVYDAGQKSSRDRVLLSEIHSKVNSIFRRIVFSIQKEDTLTHSWEHIQEAAREIVYSNYTHGPHTLDGLLFISLTTNQRLYWVIDPLFRLSYARSPVDPILYARSLSGGRIPVPGFCVTSNLYPQATALFRARPVKKEERKLGSFELYQLTKGCVADSIEMTMETLAYLQNPISSSVFLESSVKVPIPTPELRGFQPIVKSTPMRSLVDVLKPEPKKTSVKIKNIGTAGEPSRKKRCSSSCTTVVKRKKKDQETISTT